MIDIENREYKPSYDELCGYVENDLFDLLHEIMLREYSAAVDIEYSGDKVLLGWNVKYKKAGRTLCRVYPRKGYFPMLLIVGRREKQAVEELLPSLGAKINKIYSETKEGMGQRWMLLEFRKDKKLFDDALKIIRIRRQSK